MARPRKLTPIEEQLIYDQRKQGVSVTELAFKNNVSVKTIERIVKRIGEESK